MAVATIDVCDAAIQRFDVKCVEIDQVLLIHDAVRIVTGGAGGPFVPHMFAVEAIGHQHALTVALVAKSVGGGAFRLEINADEVSFQERRVAGAVRAAGAVPFGTGSLVVIVAVGTGHLPGAGPRGNQRAIRKGFGGAQDGVIR